MSSLHHTQVKARIITVRHRENLTRLQLQWKLESSNLMAGMSSLHHTRVKVRIITILVVCLI